MTGKRENVLIEALPYIRDFYGSVMVIKVGGHAMVNPSVMSDIIQDVVLLRFVGIHPVIVHGGGPEITEKMERMGKKPEFVGGLRITDDETMEIARMVLVGNINTKIVSLIGKHGGKGVGLSGKDGKMIMAKRKGTQKIMIEDVEHDVDLGWVGETEIINPELINIVTANDYIPVISPIAMDAEGNALNINADTVAGDLADALHAKKLILMTDVPGVLRDQSDTSSRISRISVDDVEPLIEEGVIGGGMIPKMRSAKASVIGGVERVHIIDGSVSHSVLLELFTDKGIGTMVYQDTE
ncbi:acetylglutamate kinase [Methanococcoides methylutens]|uniref:Acetylglutamate kinase n=1 Tax=Methanococcoides methylutens MM1 TaxID=1434104 RepID=A0A0E3SRA6_METMT|nr:acetylglutamate kinase [Methanococcoides methylutens]AKB84692.1 Acetylglutamate kinase [Methanococcoides methylutens MM1]